jgi:hypothetical protein
MRKPNRELPTAEQLRALLRQRLPPNTWAVFDLDRLHVVQLVNLLRTMVVDQ